MRSLKMKLYSVVTYESLPVPINPFTVGFARKRRKRWEASNRLRRAPKITIEIYYILYIY